MAETEASIGYGTTLELAYRSAPTVFTFIGEVFNPTPPAVEDATVEATHNQSPGRFREYIPSLSEGGEAEFEMNYVPGSPSDLFIIATRGKKLIARMTFPNGVQIIFNCSRQGYEKEAPVDDRMTATLTLKVSGEPIQTAAGAPRNLELPAIEGLAKVGVPLVAKAGAWAGALEFEYQWQADNVNVAGATGQSFIPLVGNVGDVITVVVTGKNGTAFEVDAESPGTAAVAA